MELEILFTTCIWKDKTERGRYLQINYEIFQQIQGAAFE